MNGHNVFRPSSPSSADDFRPRYAKIQKSLLGRITAGEWKAGDALPSEQKLAAEYSVAPGTMRKAIDFLVKENLLIRRHGKGTFITTPQWRDMLLRIFRLYPNKGERDIPSSKVVGHQVRPTTASEAAALQIDLGDEVIEVFRVRLFAGSPIISEQLLLPLRYYTNVDTETLELPPSLYEYYAEKLGIMIVDAEESLRAVTASGSDLTLLDVAPGAPLLEIERTAIDAQGRRVEWRLSRCNTAQYHYRNRVL